MQMPTFYGHVEEARALKQRVFAFMCPTSKDIEMYFVRDILNPDTDLIRYDYSETKPVEFSTLRLVKENPKVITIKPISLDYLIKQSVAVDYGMSSDEIRGYFIKFSQLIEVDLFLRIYQYSMHTQRKISKEDLEVSLTSLYNKVSIRKLSSFEVYSMLNQCKSLKFKYIGMLYLNIYTFDLFIQVHYKPNIDTLMCGVTSPLSGNFLVKICPGDTIEQVMSDYYRLQVDLRPILFQRTEFQ